MVSVLLLRQVFGEFMCTELGHVCMCVCWLCIYNECWTTWWFSNCKCECIAILSSRSVSGWLRPVEMIAFRRTICVPKHTITSWTLVTRVGCTRAFRSCNIQPQVDKYIYTRNLQTITARADRPYFNIPIVYSSGPVTTSYWQKITSILVNAIVYVIPLYKRIYFTFSAPLVIQLIWRAWNRCHPTDNIVGKSHLYPRQNSHTLQNAIYNRDLKI